MALFNRFRRGFASSKSVIKNLLKSSTARQGIALWKVLTGKAFKPVPIRVRGENRVERRIRVFLVLGIIMAAGSVMAQRPIGIDVSDYQSATISWTTLKNTYGISFAWAKASEATCSTSCGGGNWPTYVANAKAAGVYIGPYHFARYDLNPGTNGAVTEANFFWSVVGGDVKADGKSLMPMLDVEASFTGQTQTTLSQWVDTWCTTISNSAYAAGRKVKPCVYISSSHASTYLNSTVTKWNTDIADWPYAHASAASSAQSAANPPAGMTPWTSWQFWQYDDQNVAEAYTDGDGDIFNGTLAQMTNTMLVTSIGPSITTQPKSVTTVAGTNVSFSVTATGVGTLQYQWKFDTTNISTGTASSYSITNVQITNAGMYAVSVKDTTSTTVQSTNVYLAVVGPVSNGPGATVVAPQGMVDWWPADGNGNDIFGTVTAVPWTNLIYAPGESGLAFKFDGHSAFLTTGAADIPVPWTACMWVKRASGAGTSAGLLEDGTNSLKLEQFSNTFNVGISVIGSGDYVFSPAYSAPIGTWVHLSFVGTSGGTSLFVNGAFQGAVTNSIPLPRAYIGCGYVSSSSKYIDFLSGSLTRSCFSTRR